MQTRKSNKDKTFKDLIDTSVIRKVSRKNVDKNLVLTMQEASNSIEQKENVNYIANPAPDCDFEIINRH
jgi:hypothetical protein